MSRSIAGAVWLLAVFTALVATDTKMNRLLPAEVSSQRVRSFLTANQLTVDATPDWSTTDIRSLVDRAAARAAAAFPGDPGTEARARVVLAGHYAELGLWRDVDAQGTRAIALLEECRQTRSRIYAAALAHAGFARARQGDASAEPVLRRALSLEDAQEKPSARITEEARQGLDLLARSGDPMTDAAAARAHYDGSLAWLLMDGNFDSEWLSSLSTYIEARIQRGKTGEALRAIDRENDLVRRLPDEPATTRAVLLQVSGGAYSQLERWKDAESAYREAVSARQGRLDGRLPPALSNLATTLLRQGRPAEAIGIYDQAVIARCNLLASSTPAARPAFEAVAENIRRNGVGPADVRALDGLLRRHAPDIVPMFLHTARRIAETHAQLGHGATSEALLEVIQDLDSAPAAVPITARLTSPRRLAG